MYDLTNNTMVQRDDNKMNLLSLPLIRRQTPQQCVPPPASESCTRIRTGGPITELAYVRVRTVRRKNCHSLGRRRAGARLKDGPEIRVHLKDGPAIR
jgi:hypothetical protein